MARWPREGLGLILATAAHGETWSQEKSLRPWWSRLPRLSQSQRGGRVDESGRPVLLPEGIQPLSEGLLGSGPERARWERSKQRYVCPSICVCFIVVGSFRREGGLLIRAGGWGGGNLCRTNTL